MLVLSPGDYYAFGQMSEERLGIEWPSGVVLQEVTILLAKHLAMGKLKVGSVRSFPPAAYVDPTHSVRVKSRYDAPRELISAILQAPPVELFWRRDRTHPCGNVALQYTEPHISDHLTYSRLGDASQEPVPTIIPTASFGLDIIADNFGWILWAI
jgi:Fe-S oxidoreductase